MGEEKKGTKKYFEAIIPENEHMSDKTDDDGYQSGLTFPDEGKGTKGPMRVREIDPIEEQRKVDLMIAQYQAESAAYETRQKQQHENTMEMIQAGREAGEALAELLPYLIRFGFWCKETAYPTLKNRTVPWAKRNVSRIFNRKKRIERTTAEESNKSQANSETTRISPLEQFTPEAFLSAASNAHYQYRLNVSNEEAQRHFLNMVLAAAIVAKEIRFFSEHTVVPDNVRLDQEQYRAWQVALEEFATEKVAESINDILKSDSPMLKEPAFIPLFLYIGGKISEEKVLIPIKQQDLQSALEID